MNSSHNIESLCVFQNLPFILRYVSLFIIFLHCFSDDFINYYCSFISDSGFMLTDKTRLCLN